MSGAPGAVTAKDAELTRHNSPAMEPVAPATIFDAIPEGVRESLLVVYRENGYDSKDVVDAWLAIRPVLKSDAEAVDVIRNIAPQGAVLGAPSLRGLSVSLRDAVRSGDIENPAHAELVPGSKTQREARITPDGRGVIVPGGAKSPKLPPARELGAPDPELGKMIDAGRARYHLSALEELAAADREREREIEVEIRELDREAHANVLRPVIDSMLEDMSLAVGLPAATVGFSSGAAIRELDEIERVRMEALGRELARAVTGNASDADVRETTRRLDGALEKPCGSAGCRTLKECLCNCRRCRAACASRRRRR